MLFSFTLCSRSLFAEEAPAGEPGKEVKAEDPRAVEWKEDSDRIQKLKGELQKEKAELKELYESKDKIKSPEEATALAKDITKKNAALKEDYDEYRKIQLKLRFEHPEKGDFSEHKYKREESAEPSSDEPLEDHYEVGLQGKLDKVKANFAAHYSVPAKLPVAKNATSEATREPAAEAESKRIILAK